MTGHLVQWRVQAIRYSKKLGWNTRTVYNKIIIKIEYNVINDSKGNIVYVLGTTNKKINKSKKK